MLLITYKAIHDIAPTYISELIYKPNRQLRSSSELLLVTPSARSVKTATYDDCAFRMLPPSSGTTYYWTSVKHRQSTNSIPNWRNTYSVLICNHHYVYCVLHYPPFFCFSFSFPSSALRTSVVKALDKYIIIVIIMGIRTFHSWNVMSSSNTHTTIICTFLADVTFQTVLRRWYDPANIS